MRSQDHSESLQPSGTRISPRAALLTCTPRQIKYGDVLVWPWLILVVVGGVAGAVEVLILEPGGVAAYGDDFNVVDEPIDHGDDSWRRLPAASGSSGDCPTHHHQQSVAAEP